MALRWDDPSNDSITTYQLRYKKGSGFASGDYLWTDIPGSGSDTTGHSVSGLTNGMEYVFQIRAGWYHHPIRATRYGGISTPVTATPSATPVNPTGFKARAGDGRVALSWDDPLNDSITKYQLRHKAGSELCRGR